MAVGEAGGARTMPVTGRQVVKKAKEKDAGRQGGSTPGRPRLRTAEKKRATATPVAPQHDATSTPTRQLRKQAAEEGRLSMDSPTRHTPRLERPRMLASPPVDGASGTSSRGSKRRAVEQEPGEEIEAERPRKKSRKESDKESGRKDGREDGREAGKESGKEARNEPASAEAATPTSAQKGIKVFRTFTGSGLKGMLRKDKTPSSEDLRRDPDENYEWKEARLPTKLSAVFSRGAVPTTLLDSTTEASAQPRAPQDAQASDGETENG